MDRHSRDLRHDGLCRLCERSAAQQSTLIYRILKLRTGFRDQVAEKLSGCMLITTH
ncbi:MAG: hypothetical protein NTW22_06250 [Proteobacteria bacterium]|nr:hypothetical protein [Pseudomonadota bacterium]